MAGRRCKAGFEVFDETQGKCVSIKDAIKFRAELINGHAAEIMRGEEETEDEAEAIEILSDEIKQLVKMMR